MVKNKIINWKAIFQCK